MSHAVILLLAGLTLSQPMPDPAEKKDPPQKPAEEQPREPPIVQAVRLKDVDRSHEIRNPPVHAAADKTGRALRPRVPIDFEQFRRALWNGHANIVAALVAEGADVNAAKDGEPILHYAIWDGRLDLIEILLQGGADPNRPRADGDRPLHRVVWQKNARIAELLLRYGADPRRTDKEGGTPLADAKWYRQSELIKLLEAPLPKQVEPRPHAGSGRQVLRRPAAILGSEKFAVGGGGRALCYSPDGKWLIAGDYEGALRFCDARTGVLEHVLVAHPGDILALAFIPKTRILVSAGDDSTVRFWDTETFTELMRLADHFGQAKALSVSQDGRLINTGWNTYVIESTRPLRLAPKGRAMTRNYNAGVLWSFFTPDDRYLVFARQSKGIWAWDLAADRLARISESNELSGLSWQDLAAAVDIGKARRDDLLALITTRGYTMVTGPSGVLQALRGALGRFEYQDEALAISPDGQFLAGIGYGSPLRIYDLERKVDSHQEHPGHTRVVQAVAYSPDGRHVASGGDDTTVRLWDVKTRKQIAKLDAGDGVSCMRFAPDGKLLAIGNGSGGIHLWNMKDEEPQRGHSRAGWITGLVFDPKHGELLSVGTSAVIHFHDLKTLQTRRIVSTWGTTRSVGVSRDGRWVITGAGDLNGTEARRYPLFWPRDKLPEATPPDTVSLNHSQVVRPASEETHTSEIDCLEVSPDGALLATGSGDASVRLWDMKTLRPIAKLCGHTTGLTDVKFSPDGKWLASASWDGTVKIWDVQNHRQLAVLDGDVYRVEGLAFSSDGLSIATANADSTVHLWDLAPLRLLRAR